MNRNTLPTVLVMALLAIAPAASPARAEMLAGEATAVVSLLPADWPEEFREQWLMKERSIEDDRRREEERLATVFSEEAARLREDLAEGMEELQEDFREELEELREEFKEKRSDILSSNDDPEDKESDLSDLDDDFYDERDELEELQRGKVMELQRQFDGKVADLAREREQGRRKAARDLREEAEAIVSERKEALLRLHLNRLRIDAVAEAARRRGIDPFGEPFIAADLLDRLGSRASFSESSDGTGRGSAVRLAVSVRIDEADLATVVGQWGLVVPPVPIVIRFSGWRGDPREVNGALFAAGLFDRDHSVGIDGDDVVVTAAGYLPRERIAERLNRILVGGRELRAVASDEGLRVTPFP